jgi:hypothetical protein
VDDRFNVITIVWSSRDGWEADLVGIGQYDGREFRG